jgi:hypothetical protein
MFRSLIHRTLCLNMSLSVHLTLDYKTISINRPFHSAFFIEKEIHCSHKQILYEMALIFKFFRLFVTLTNQSIFTNGK